MRRGLCFRMEQLRIAVENGLSHGNSEFGKGTIMIEEISGEGQILIGLPQLRKLRMIVDFDRGIYRTRGKWKFVSKELAFND